MKEISDVTAMVVDKGLFLPFARRMAERCKRVLYYNPERHQFPSTHQGSIGDGFPDIEHSDTLWRKKREVDLYIFPDIGMADEQEELVRQGFPVWGSRSADRIETNRELFMSLLADFGLKVPPHVVVTGITELAALLYDAEDKIIKVSKWRGDVETQKWRNWAMDNGWIWETRTRLGPLADKMRFIVCDVIDTKLEIGGDTYYVRDQLPSLMLNGLEHKDTTYLSAVTERDKMPDICQQILEKFSPIFGHLKAATQWSMEIRVKDGEGTFIDPTPRGGMPSSASQQLCWENFPEIVWAGANGELVEPKPAGLFTIECAVSCKNPSEGWLMVELDEAIDRQVRFSNCCRVDGVYAFPPNPNMGGILGWLCAVASTPLTALELAKDITDRLPEGLDANLENMVGLVQEAEEAMSQGIPFTNKQLPSLAQVVEE